MMVAAASGSVGETIAPRTKATSQGRPGTSVCAAQATAHIGREHQPDRAERERAQVGPKVAEVRIDRRAVEKRRQEDDQHDLGVEPHLGQAGNESEYGAADNEHDRIRHGQLAGERAQARDGHQQSGDQKLGLAHSSSVPIRQPDEARTISPVAIRPVPMRGASAARA
jgi:hypothetical protein